jgi:hypothetical protein
MTSLDRVSQLTIARLCQAINLVNRWLGKADCRYGQVYFGDPVKLLLSRGARGTFRLDTVVESQCDNIGRAEFVYG